MELYSYVPPPGLNTPISVEPFLVDDSVPTEDKIEWAVKLLHNHRPGRPSGMRAKQLKGWLALAWKKEKEEAVAGEENTEGNMGRGGESTEHTEASNWGRVVDLVQTALREGQLAQKAMWQAVVLITKGKKYYRGIGIVEVMWKVVAAILNLRLTASISFHDSLHRFWAGRSIGTATLEANLLQ